jgi:hypothetical protein
MPIKSSENIPSMFGRVWTGPPEAALWDMYENDASFDEASQNVMDTSMADFSDLLGEDPDLEDQDPDALEKAIYQINVAMDNDLDPSGINTPYGPGLGLEEISALVEQYPAIEAGLELGAMEDYFSDADFFVDGASDELDAIIDAVGQRTEAEGRIGEESSFWGRIGDQLSGLFNIDTAYASEGLPPPEPPIEPEDDSGILGMLKGAASGIADLFAEGVTTQTEGRELLAGGTQAFTGMGTGMARPGDLELSTLFDPKPDGSYLTLAEILEELRPTADLPGWDDEDERTTPDEIASWMSYGGFDARARQAGHDPEKLRAILESMAPGASAMTGGYGEELVTDPKDVLLGPFVRGDWGEELDEGIDYEPPEGQGVPIWETDQWADLFPGASAAVDPGVTFGESRYGETQKRELEEWLSGLGPRATAMYEYYLGRNWTPAEARAEIERQIDLDRYTDETPVTTATDAEAPATGTLTPEQIPTTPTNGDVDPQRAVGQAQAGTTPAVTVNENLLKTFYSKMYAQPGSGRWDVQKALPDLFGQTKALFFLQEGRDAWDAYGADITNTVNPEARAAGLKTLETRYNAFLDEYLRNPAAKRSGSNFRNSLSNLNNLLGKNEDAAVSANQQPEWTWAQANFGGKEGKTNRDTLIKLHATQGGTGYYSQRIHSAIDRLLTYHRTMGKDETEIFALMTKAFGRTQPAETPDQSIAKPWYKTFGPSDAWGQPASDAGQTPDDDWVAAALV